MNPRQERFVAAYLQTLDPKQAAVAAGYSPRSAQINGHRLLKKAEIRAVVAQKRAIQLEKLDVDAQFVLNRLVELSGVDIIDLLDSRGRLRKIEEIPKEARRFIAGFEVTERWEPNPDGEPTRVEVTKVRLIDRLKALEMLGKHVRIGAFAEKEKDTRTLVIIRDYTGREPKEREIDVTPLSELPVVEIESSS